MKLKNRRGEATSAQSYQEFIVKVVTEHCGIVRDDELDHTLSLFKKHGMTNLIYTTPMDEKTASNTLVYVIAHKSRDAAKESWKAFIGDPDWKKAYRNSIKDGKLVTKVQSQYLNATDYSPSK